MSLDRDRRVTDALHKSWAIQAASKRASTAQDAGKWFSQYGHNVAGKDACGVSLVMNYAGSCVGSKEAKEYMEKAILAMLPQIAAEASAMADRDMAELLRLIYPDEDATLDAAKGSGG